MSKVPFAENQCMKKRKNAETVRYFQARAKRIRRSQACARDVYHQTQASKAMRGVGGAGLSEVMEVNRLRPVFRSMNLDFHLTESDWNWSEDTVITLVEPKEDKKKSLFRHDFFDHRLDDGKTRLEERLSGFQKPAFELAVDKRVNVFLTGGAGVGKSLTLMAIVQALRTKGLHVAKLAPTGIAADNIQGATWDSFMGISIGSYQTGKSAEQLVGERGKSAIHALQSQMIDCLVIDEISMLERLKFDTGYLLFSADNEKARPFGGKQIIACGDFFQLPPIDKSSDGKTQNKAEMAFESRYWNAVFPPEHCIELTQSYRQLDTSFSDFLNRVRIGQIDDAQMETLATLGLRRLQAEEGRRIPFVMHLFGTRWKAKRHNEEQLIHLIHQLQQCAQNPDQSRQVHTFQRVIEFKPWSAAEQTKHKAARAKIAENRKGMTRVEFEKWYRWYVQPFERRRDQAESMVTNQSKSSETLTLARGARVMLTHNISVQKRLVKSRQGWITHLDEYDHCPHVWFDNDECTTKITPFEWKSDCRDGQCVARQLPLELAWAMTIHKSQSLSLNAAAIDLTEIFAEGQAYVALSRVREWGGLFLTGYRPGSIVCNPRVAAFYQNRFPESWPASRDPIKTISDFEFVNAEDPMELLVATEAPLVTKARVVPVPGQLAQTVPLPVAPTVPLPLQAEIQPHMQVQEQVRVRADEQAPEPLNDIQTKTSESSSRDLAQPDPDAEWKEYMQRIAKQYGR